MADETTTTWTDLLREAKGPLVEALRWATVTLSEVQRDSNPRRWNGKQVTVPLFLSPQQGTGMIAETAGPNNAITSSTDQAVINSATIAIAVSFTTMIMKQSTSGENGWADVVPTKMRRAEEAFKRVLNEQMIGGGRDATDTTTVLLAPVTATNNNSTTVDVGTAANFYQLYPGRVVDVLTRSTGTPVANGSGVEITDYDESAGEITLNTALTTTNTEGVYIQGSYGNALQGIGEAVATTGTFETINKATVWAWQGTDASPAAATDPTISVFDKAERLAAQRCGMTPDFYIADPAVVDKYTQGLTVQARWAGEEGQLESGWTGVRYRDKLIVPEFDSTNSQALGISKEDMTLYSLDPGPDWDDYTGSVFQRFARTLPLESWLVWMLQLGFHRCNSFVKVANLNRAD